jgi:hypothetical protein
VISDEQVILIKHAKHVGDYKLELVFNDNSSQQIDFFPFLASSLNPLIKKYLNSEEFRKFSIDDGDLEWNDYDLCFPIADLYENRIMR